MFASLAVAAGEVEVALEVARLTHDLGAAEDEVVGVEQAAQVGVGEDARRRRVTRALESVEKMAREVLSNPIIEDYRVELEA